MAPEPWRWIETENLTFIYIDLTRKVTIMIIKIAATLGVRIVIASICFGCITYGTAHTQTIVDVPARLEAKDPVLQQPLPNGHYYRPSARVLRAKPPIHVYVFDDLVEKERWIVLNMHWTNQSGGLRNDLNFPILRLLVLPLRKEWAPNLTWHKGTDITSALISTKLLIKHMPAGIERLRQYLDVVKPYPVPKEASNR